MKFRVSTQLSPFSRTAAEVINFIDIDRRLSEDEFVAAVDYLQQTFTGCEINASLTLAPWRIGNPETVKITLTELSEDEQAVITQKHIEARRHTSGYSYGEWELVSKGGAGRTDWTSGTRHAETASVYALPILDVNNTEVDRLIEVGGLATKEVQRIRSSQLFEKWIAEKLYADDPTKLLQLFWDDDAPYKGLLHRPECLKNLGRHLKKQFVVPEADGGYSWDLGDGPYAIPIYQCEGCQPKPEPEVEPEDLPF